MYGLFKGAERKKHLGLTIETTEIPKEDQEMLKIIENSGLGIHFANNLEVTKFQGPNMQKTDEYVAVRAPGPK